MFCVLVFALFLLSGGVKTESVQEAIPISDMLDCFTAVICEEKKPEDLKPLADAGHPVLMVELYENLTRNFGELVDSSDEFWHERIFLACEMERSELEEISKKTFEEYSQYVIDICNIHINVEICESIPKNEPILRNILLSKYHNGVCSPAQIDNMKNFYGF